MGKPSQVDTTAELTMDKLSKPVNKYFLYQQLTRLAESQGKRIQNDLICVENSSDCQSLRDWMDGVAASVEEVLEYVVEAGVVRRRIQSLDAVGCQQKKEYSCWAMSSFILRAMQNNQKKRVMEEDEILLFVPPIPVKKYKAFLAVQTYHRNNIPSLLSDALGVKTDADKDTLAQNLNDSISWFKTNCSNWNRYDNGKDQSIYLDKDIEMKLIKSAEFYLDSNGTSYLIASLTEDPEKYSLHAYFYLRYQIDNGVSQSDLDHLFTILNLKQTGKENNPVYLYPDTISRENLSRKLRKSPLIFCLPMKVFRTPDAELLAFYKANPQHFSSENHVVIVYDLYYDFTVGNFMVRIANTGMNEHEEHLDPYPYQILNKPMPEPNSYATFQDIVFQQMSLPAFFEALKDCVRNAEHYSHRKEQIRYGIMSQDDNHVNYFSSY